MRLSGLNIIREAGKGKARDSIGDLLDETTEGRFEIKREQNRVGYELKCSTPKSLFATIFPCEQPGPERLSSRSFSVKRNRFPKVG